jgi:hypothetical protein
MKVRVEVVSKKSGVKPPCVLAHLRVSIACSQMNNRQRASSLGRATVVRCMSIAEVFGH